MPLTIRRTTMRSLQSFKFCSFTLAAVLLGGFSSARFADAAVIKITQSKAQNGAVTTGDTPGFPVTISQSGSYILDGNLTVPSNMDGIHITAPRVSLDLNGFTIRGSGGIGGSGIIAYGTVENITVRNGFVTGMGAQGIWVAGATSRIENMTVFGNDGWGISLGDRATVTDSNSSANNEGGIQVGTNSTILDSTVS